jgi:hypothetical protein
METSLTDLGITQEPIKPVATMPNMQSQHTTDTQQPGMGPPMPQVQSLQNAFLPPIQQQQSPAAALASSAVSPPAAVAACPNSTGSNLHIHNKHFVLFLLIAVAFSSAAQEQLERTGSVFENPTMRLVLTSAAVVAAFALLSRCLM